jgi:hypothetical protein
MHSDWRHMTQRRLARRLGRAFSLFPLRGLLSMQTPREPYCQLSRDHRTPCAESERVRANRRQVAEALTSQG